MSREDTTDGTQICELRQLRSTFAGAPDAVRFLNCNHCGSSLEIKHTDSITYSEKIAQIDERTERIEQKLEILELERELDQLDHRWHRDREQLMVTGKDGRTRVPTVGGAIFGGIVSTVIGVFFIVAGFSSSHGIPLAMGCAVIAIGGCVALFGLTKASAYNAAEERYQQNRRDIEHRLKALRDEPSPSQLRWADS